MGSYAQLGAQAQTLRVQHWWTSAGERDAVDALDQALRAEGITWISEPVPGGGGAAAGKVLKTRILAGDPPDAAQIIGQTLGDWSELGLVLPLDDVASDEHWGQVLLPVVQQAIEHRGQVIAAPLGVHRINWVFYSQPLWSQYRLPPPNTWANIEAAARTLRAHGIAPLAWSDEPWQLGTVFEAVLLSEAGPALYAELALGKRWQAWQSPAVRGALQRLRWLRSLSGISGLGGSEPGEPAWTQAALQLYKGRAGMMLMGDWVEGELIAWGQEPQRDFGCVALPGTAGLHLYSIDTLGMLVGKGSKPIEQQRLAALVARPLAQLAYNRAKGSVPVRVDIDPAQLNPCARESWRLLNAPGGASRQLPSLTHRMAASENRKDAIDAALSRFVRSGGESPEQAQQRLAAIIRGLSESTID